MISSIDTEAIAEEVPPAYKDRLEGLGYAYSVYVTGSGRHDSLQVEVNFYDPDTAFVDYIFEQRCEPTRSSVRWAVNNCITRFLKAEEGLQ